MFHGDLFHGDLFHGDLFHGDLFHGGPFHGDPLPSLRVPFSKPEQIRGTGPAVSRASNTSMTIPESQSLPRQRVTAVGSSASACRAAVTPSDFAFPW